MSNKISGFTVAFEESVTEEYMEIVKQAVILIKGVVKVDIINEGAITFIGEMRERSRITEALLELIQANFKDKPATK